MEHLQCSLWNLAVSTLIEPAGVTRTLRCDNDVKLVSDERLEREIRN